MNLFFNVKKQHGINAEAQGDMPGRLINQSIGVLSRWQKPGDVTSVARFTTQPNTNDGYFQYSSDGVYSDASFIRLSNLSLNYNLPDKMTKLAGIQGCSLFIHSNNLFIITKYKGLDPETQDFKGLPPTKIIVGGISLNF